MLNQNNNVIFSYNYGINSQSFRCRSVKQRVQMIGQVVEDLDFDMVEDYEGVRHLVSIEMELTFTQSLWIANFLAGSGKKLTIDGTEIEVINAQDEFDFELLNGYNAYAEVELTFYKKSKGLPSFSEQQVFGYLEDDLIGVV